MMRKRNSNKDVLHAVISVESRKGGVGKTTAALCLAKLLHQKGREVLLLDTDITGTNVNDALDSDFWKRYIYIVKEMVGTENEKQDYKKANLLKLFERGFMAGKGVPCFKLPNQTKVISNLTFKRRTINVIGSEIYDEKANKLICKPSILFDELHAFWFAQYLAEICKQFRDIIGKDKKTAIIIDNSPGYVGIGPVIQDWLIDEGVDKSKFLFVSSLDQQDLTACLKAMEYLHSTYSQKWTVAKELSEKKADHQKDSKNIAGKKEVSNRIKDNMKFVMRLLENKKLDHEENELGFYLKRGLRPEASGKDILGDAFDRQIDKYQGIVVNKVAQRFKKGWWRYSINEENEKVGHLLTENHYQDVSTNVMVEYSEYIETQFTQKSAIRIEREWRGDLDEWQWVCESARMALDSYENKNLSCDQDFDRIFDRLENYQAIIDDFMGRLANIPSYILRDLVHHEWQPKAIGQDFSRWLSQAVHGEFRHFPEKRKKMHNDKHKFHLMMEMAEEARMYSRNAFYEEMSHGKKIWDEILNSGIAVLSLGMQDWWGVPFEKELFGFGHFVGQICATEIKHWSCKGKRSEKSIAMFLANDQVDKDEFREKLFRKMPPPIRYSFEKDGRGMKRFYEAFAKAQARILDLDQDVRFLISIIEKALKEDSGREGLLPYIGGVAKKVIVNKTMSHEEGMEACQKGFRIAESLEQFEGVLSNVLDKWEID